MSNRAIGLFDDDDGADFAAEILKTHDMSIIVGALNSIPTEDWEYVSNSDGVRALLAAEIVADQMAHESGDLSDDLHSWAHEFGEPDSDLISLARNAVKRILLKSETRDLWSDSETFSQWLSKTNDLINRLN